MAAASSQRTAGFRRRVRRLGRRFRERRNAELAALIRRIAAGRQDAVSCLDVGGAPIFWETVEPRVAGLLNLTLLNLPGDECHERFTAASFRSYLLEHGDARDLRSIRDRSYDLVVANSVIEHVGTWEDVQRACAEIRRVGRNGWVQTPSFACFWEPHFHLPFVHWLAAPLRARMVARLSPAISFDPGDVAAARQAVDGINLLTRHEVRALFPGCELRVERFLGWPKSYLVSWTSGAC